MGPVAVVVAVGILLMLVAVAVDHVLWAEQQVGLAPQGGPSAVSVQASVWRWLTAAFLAGIAAAAVAAAAALRGGED